MKLPIPKAVRRQLGPLEERGERFLREWEWTWTSAFVAGVVISFVALTTMAVIPSWILYFFGERGWEEERWQIFIRDVVATGWTFTWAAIFVITAYKVQVIRRRLRGEKQAERYAGGYR